MQESAFDQEQQVARIQAFVDELKRLPIAIETDAANEQHYEVRSSEDHLRMSLRHLAAGGAQRTD